MLTLVATTPPCYKRSVQKGDKFTTSADGGSCGLFPDDESIMPYDIPPCQALIRPPADENEEIQQMTLVPAPSMAEFLDREMAIISVRARNVLQCLDADNPGELLKLSHDELMHARNCGKKTAAEIEKLQCKLRETYTAETQDVLALPTWVEDAPQEVFEAIKATLSVRGVNTIEALKITNIKDFMFLNEKRLLKCRNCGRKTASEIGRLQGGISDYAIELACRPSGLCAQDLVSAPCLAGNASPKDNAPDGSEYYVDIENPARWLCDWVNNLARSERQARAFMLHKGMLGHKPMTLECAGDQIGGVTRERIRQMEKELGKRAAASHQQQRIKPLIDAIVLFVDQHGGMTTLDELTQNILCKGQQGKQLRFATDLLVFFATLSIWKDAGLNIQEGGVVSHGDALSFVSRIADVLESTAAADADERYGEGLWGITLNRLKKSLHSVCKPVCEMSSPAILSDAVLNKALQRCKAKVKVYNNRVYSMNLWRLKHGNVVQMVETVLRQIGRPAHYSEVAKKVHKWRPDYSARNAHAALDRSDRVLLWDLGTFVHQDSISIPTSLIQDVEEWLLKTLRKTGVPFVSVNGAFMYFKNRCVKAGITSEVALYACLRRSGHHKIVYPRLPCVYLKVGFTERLPMPLALENYIRDADGSVSQEDFKDYAFNRLYLNQIQFTQCSQKMGNIVRTTDWGYLHLDNFRVDHNILESIVNYTEEVLLKEGHCSIEKIYNDKRVSCRSCDINCPIMLYSILECFAAERIVLNGYPLVVRSTSEEAKDRHTIKDKIVTFIRDLKAPCPYDLLEERLVNQLGYNERLIYAVSNEPGILVYHPSCVIHYETLAWNQSKQKELEEAARQHYASVAKFGQCYGRISQLLESTSLPELPPNLYWSSVLIADLLVKGRKYIVLGNNREAFLPYDNQLHIQTLEDLAALFLKEKWGGGANLEKFGASLVEAGIVKRRLAPSMLSPGNIVGIRHGEIYLKDLQ